MDPSELKALVSEAVLKGFIGDARATVCKRLLPVLSTLDTDTRQFIVREMFGDSD